LAVAALEVASLLDVPRLLIWSPWQPLDGCWRTDGVPNRPGLYRIRRQGADGLEYLGQTGTGSMTLRKRLAMLSGAFGDVMPYAAPHTAGPALWAVRHATGAEFDVSTVAIDGSPSWRLSVEALALALYRQQNSRSPSLNFGRMPIGYRKSSGNDARLVERGLRFRGGPTNTVEASHGPGIPPIGPLTADVQSADWCGHSWSPWRPLASSAQAAQAGSQGLYRIRGAAAEQLLYIGQGLVEARLAKHLQTALAGTGRQGAIFTEAGSLECSWVACADWSMNQRLELETDLIGAHVLYCEAPPAGQFLG
jgi:hypothetical protein